MSKEGETQVNSQEQFAFLVPPVDLHLAEIREANVGMSEVARLIELHNLFQTFAQRYDGYFLELEENDQLKQEIIDYFAQSLGGDERLRKIQEALDIKPDETSVKEQLDRLAMKAYYLLLNKIDRDGIYIDIRAMRTEVLAALRELFGETFPTDCKLSTFLTDEAIHARNEMMKRVGEELDQRLTKIFASLNNLGKPGDKPAELVESYTNAYQDKYAEFLLVIKQMSEMLPLACINRVMRRFEPAVHRQQETLTPSGLVMPNAPKLNDLVRSSDQLGKLKQGEIKDYFLQAQQLIRSECQLYVNRQECWQTETYLQIVTETFALADRVFYYFFGLGTRNGLGETSEEVTLSSPVDGLKITIDVTHGWDAIQDLLRRRIQEVRREISRLRLERSARYVQMHSTAETQQNKLLLQASNR